MSVEKKQKIIRMVAGFSNMPIFVKLFYYCFGLFWLVGWCLFVFSLRFEVLMVLWFVFWVFGNLQVC